VRPSDKLTFFEIDPLVVKVATDPKRFTYISQCSKGPIDYVIGDARLTLARQPKDLFDILLVDAFSSDSVPVHLMTVEAVKGYLSHIKPDGVVVMHLSNRNVDLIGPAMAVARQAGGIARVQSHVINPKAPALWESSEDALVIARNRSALGAFAEDPRWSPTNPFLVDPWRDDYTNLVGAIIAKARQKASNP
jgi:spermidine synthase